jgi:hypothetical protein
MVRTAKFTIFFAIFFTHFPLSRQRANTASRRINYTGRGTRVAFKCSVDSIISELPVGAIRLRVRLKLQRRFDTAAMALQDSSRVPPRKSTFVQSESANPWAAKSQENSLASTGLEHFEPFFHLLAEIISGEILYKGCQNMEVIA